jgi:hypothetical protein
VLTLILMAAPVRLQFEKKDCTAASFKLTTAWWMCGGAARRDELELCGWWLKARALAAVRRPFFDPSRHVSFFHTVNEELEKSVFIVVLSVWAVRLTPRPELLLMSFVLLAWFHSLSDIQVLAHTLRSSHLVFGQNIFKTMMKWTAQTSNFQYYKAVVGFL